MTDKNKKDALGDRMKGFENVESDRAAEKGRPIIARLDGRAFHTFTQGLRRPFDVRFSQLMIGTTIDLIEKSQALIGYTQSDEITLVWYEPKDSVKEYLFGGRFQKLTSTLAATATAWFVRNLDKTLPAKAGGMPTFDCRVWQVDKLDDVFDTLRWRELDAIKNSITMAALAHFTHKQIHGVNSDDKRRMLNDAGMPWEAEPEFFKRGTYVKRFQELRHLTEAELSVIPEFYRPTGPVERGTVKRVENMPMLQDLKKNDGAHLPSPFELMMSAT